jgi:CRP-like cAMP-binding protein
VDINRLRTLSPLNAINADNLAELASKSSPEPLEKNRIIFRAGDQDTHHVYVLDGEVELSSKDGASKIIHGGSKEAIYPLAHVKPRTMTAQSRTDCTILRINSDMLDLMPPWCQDRSIN